MSLIVPTQLAANCAKTPARRAWLQRLPSVVEELSRRWSLTLGSPFDGPEGARLGSRRRAELTAPPPY